MAKHFCSSVLLLLLQFSGYAQDVNYSSQTQQEILPWVQSAGELFGLAQEAAKNVGWDDQYLTACPRETILPRSDLRPERTPLCRLQARDLCAKG